MTKLKLIDLAEDKARSLTIELLATIHRNLVIYAAVLGGPSGKSAIAPKKLIALSTPV